MTSYKSVTKVKLFKHLNSIIVDYFVKTFSYNKIFCHDLLLFISIKQINQNVFIKK